MALVPLRLVRVLWEDASVVDDNGPWVDRADLKTPTPHVFDQVGWLLELTPQHVILSSAISEELISQRDRIPTGMVRAIFEFDPEGGRLLTIPKRKRGAANPT